MRRAIIYSCLLGQLVIFCLVTNMFESITMFMLFGVVPWQTSPLSPQSMLLFYCFAASTVITLSARKQFTQLFAGSRTTPPQVQA